MRGPHDLGGMAGFGPVRPETDEPLFHAEWEKTALAVTVAMGAAGTWNLDMSRHARERMDPVAYRRASYYEIWIDGMMRLLAEQGLATPGEMASGKAVTPGKVLARRPDRASMRAILARGAAVDRAPSRDPGFAPGDRVIARGAGSLEETRRHTRLPSYLHGKKGVIESIAGFHVYPDSHAHGLGEDPHWLYTVRFDASALFGGRTGDEVLADLWEPYLVHA